MNWIHFLLWVAGIYSVYYLSVILIDLAGSRRIPAEQQHNQELTFSETVTPTKLQHDPVAGDRTNSKPRPEAPAKRKTGPEVIGSGGVGFNELFRLAKQEAIIYTQSVSF
ncbi:hypothetical protein [Mucilaginibacter gotjawali]|uniref:Uncharacterized protein n=2 Tax=Mucilaginibacter gotjawali TaxID=1550579 RepID=A0A839SL51_9SPHI|nr:hypothetical protein [Mucilaginibacter gotjawali]MBB3058252.1 hypothetical protein [Mucilaginibacter gotjawali]BAU55629.1 hypothetical protein MgSA37_03820 [Mucilaginibacter gotjawali]